MSIEALSIDLDAPSLTIGKPAVRMKGDIWIEANGVQVWLYQGELGQLSTAAQIAEAICQKLNAAGGRVKREGSTIVSLRPEPRKTRIVKGKKKGGKRGAK